MGMMDDMKSKAKDMGDDMRARYEELKSKEDRGELDEQGRMELQKMREKLGFDK